MKDVNIITTAKERSEAVKLITSYRKLNEVQKAGFQLMLEGAKLMNEKTKKRLK